MFNSPIKLPPTKRFKTCELRSQLTGNLKETSLLLVKTPLSDQSRFHKRDTEAMGRETVLMSEMVDDSGKIWRTHHRMFAGAGGR